MNQILAVDMPNGKKSKKTSIKSIIIVFVVILIIFGIGLITNGGYSYYQSIKEKNKIPIVKTEPQISIQIIDINYAMIDVTHDKELSKVSYSINEEDPTEINTNNQTKVDKKIELPSGKVQIAVTAVDVEGVTSIYESGTYNIQKGPNINFNPVDEKIEVITENETSIEYIMYYWDNDEENASKYNVNDIKNRTLIDIPEGEHELTFIAIDKKGNKSLKTQKIKGIIKPKLEVTTDGSKFFIDAKDEKGLLKIQYKFNNGEVITENIEGKEYHKEIELENGVNKIMVVVYNKEEITETSKVKSTKE